MLTQAPVDKLYAVIDDRFPCFSPKNWHAELRSLLWKEKGNCDRPFSKCRNNINQMRLQITPMCGHRSSTAATLQCTFVASGVAGEAEAGGFLSTSNSAKQPVPSKGSASGRPQKGHTILWAPKARKPGPSLCANSRPGP